MKVSPCEHRLWGLVEGGLRALPRLPAPWLDLGPKSSALADDPQMVLVVLRITTLPNPERSLVTDFQYHLYTLASLGRCRDVPLDPGSLSWDATDRLTRPGEPQCQRAQVPGDSHGVLAGGPGPEHQPCICVSRPPSWEVGALLHAWSLEQSVECGTQRCRDWSDVTCFLCDSRTPAWARLTTASSSHPLG